MKLALNATALLSPLTGIGQYTYHLARHLQQFNELDIDFFYGVYWDKNLRHQPVTNIQNVKSSIKRFIPSPYDVVRSVKQYCFSQGIKKYSSEIYHEPNFLAFKSDKPTVITVHDLSWVRYPDAHPAERVRAMEKYFEPGLKRAQRILTDSEFVKLELIQEFNIPEEKIQPVLLGVEELFHPRLLADTNQLLKKYDLQHGQYILAVGTLEPRKNLQLALKAYMRLPTQLRKQFPLILIGMQGWNTSALEQQLAPLINAGEVRQLGYLPREELALLTAGALTLVYPSLYEGFGLPPLEAMASGVPVIASNVASIPEVVGDTGILIDPEDEDALHLAIMRLAEDSSCRNMLAEQALHRSKNFTWQRCAENTFATYKEIWAGSC